MTQPNPADPAPVTLRDVIAEVEYHEMANPAPGYCVCGRQLGDAGACATCDKPIDGPPYDPPAEATDCTQCGGIAPVEGFYFGLYWRCAEGQE